MTTTRVINLASGERFDVFIGRARHTGVRNADNGRDGYYGNPFKLTKDTPTARRAVLDAFRDHFLERIDTDPEYRRRVLALRGKTLACPGNCKPKICHGDVYVEWLEAQARLPPVCEAPCQRRVLAHPNYDTPCAVDCPRRGTE